MMIEYDSAQAGHRKRSETASSPYDRGPAQFELIGATTVKMQLSVLGILLVIGLAIMATTYRVSTAPDRIQQRREAARTTCLGAGGEWVKVGRDELCRAAAEPRKP